MSPAWKDETSYSSHDRERVPRTWTLRRGPFRVSVTRTHGLDGWYLHVQPDVPGISSGRYTRHRLPDDLEAAKAAAVELVGAQLRQAAAAWDAEVTP